MFFKFSANVSSSVVDKLLTGGFQLSDFNFAGFKASAETEVLLLALNATGIFCGGNCSGGWFGDLMAADACGLDGSSGSTSFNGTVDDCLFTSKLDLKIPPAASELVSFLVCGSSS